MKRIWLDSNLIIRIVTNDPPEQTAKAGAFLTKAEQGAFRLVVTPVIVAECVWVLSSFYKHSKVAVAAALSKVLTNPGLEVLEERSVQSALTLMAEKNVAFIDAFIATKARAANEPVASFDRDYRKLGVERVAIE